MNTTTNLVGRTVYVLKAYSAETRRRTIADEFAGCYGIVVSVAQVGSECEVELDDGRVVWLYVSRLQPASTS